jgi:hypothetical protein
MSYLEIARQVTGETKITDPSGDEVNEGNEVIAPPWCCVCGSGTTTRIGPFGFCDLDLPAAEVRAAILANPDFCAALARDLDKLYREGLRACARHDERHGETVLAVIHVIAENELRRLVARTVGKGKTA